MHTTNPASAQLVTQSPPSTGRSLTMLDQHPHSQKSVFNASTPGMDEEKRANDEGRNGGYPAFSFWMNSSNDFLVLRRFGQLGTRAALLLQDDLIQLERKLDNFDDYVKKSPNGDSGSLQYDKYQKAPRDKLLREAVPLLKQYWEYLDAFSKMKERHGAQDVQVRNVERWLLQHDGAIEQKEQEFINREGDLIALVSRPKSILRLFLEQCRVLRLVFSLKHRRDREKTPGTNYYSDRHFDTFTSLTIIVGGLMMLFGPMWLLSYENRPPVRLGIITGFVSLFALLLFGATTSASRGFEVLAATAAYAAVLTVFLQNS